MLNPSDWVNHVGSLGLSPRWGITMNSIDAGSPLEKLHPYDRIEDLWGLPSCPLDHIEHVGNPGDVLRLESGRGGMTWGAICSVAEHYRVLSYPAEPPTIRGAFSKHNQTAVWDSDGNEYTRYGPSTVGLQFLTVPISIRHSFTHAESVVYNAHRGEGGRLVSPLQGNSTIDIKFRDLLPGIMAEYGVFPQEIGLGMLSCEQLSA